MAYINIPAGSRFSVNRANLVTMLEELETEWSVTLVHMDKEERFRGINRERLETMLVAILTAASDTDSIELFGTGTSFRACRPLIRRMLIASYAAI